LGLIRNARYVWSNGDGVIWQPWLKRRSVLLCIRVYGRMLAGGIPVSLTHEVPIDIKPLKIRLAVKIDIHQGLTLSQGLEMHYVKRVTALMPSIASCN
jgi:hypothetical protein